MDAEAPQRTAELDAADASEEEQNPEAQAVHTKNVLELPIQAEVTAHDAVHCPYRSWCEVFVAASAKEDAHARSPITDEESGLPIVSMDYELLEGKVTVLIVKDHVSGAVLAYACFEKGPAD